jgi:predicted TIM-barrel fold metal-dependent hydrolase
MELIGDHARCSRGRVRWRSHPTWPHLRRAIDAFGAERVIWASDHTVIQDHTWADLLYCIRDHPEIEPTEKEWILGRSLRKILDWPASDRMA